MTSTPPPQPQNRGSITEVFEPIRAQLEGKSHPGLLTQLGPQHWPPNGPFPTPSQGGLGYSYTLTGWWTWMVAGRTFASKYEVTALEIGNLKAVYEKVAAAHKQLQEYVQSLLPPAPEQGVKPSNPGVINENGGDLP